jgi:hypothetical protein
MFTGWRNEIKAEETRHPVALAAGKPGELEYDLQTLCAVTMNCQHNLSRTEDDCASGLPGKPLAQLV